MATEKLLEAIQEQMTAQQKRHEEQMEVLLSLFRQQTAASSTGTPTSAELPAFTPFDPSSEHWKDYWSRFCTYVEAHGVASDRIAHVFLTNQSPVVYKTLANMASQQSPPKDVNKLSIKEIEEHMLDQFHPKRFVARERSKLWATMNRKPGESVQELAARIRQDAVTCDFPSITDPLDEAMRTRSLCSINNEAVLKAMFKIKDDELTFARAIEIATETEEAAKVAKETVHGQPAKPINKVQSGKHFKKDPKTCFRCDKMGHDPSDCYYRESTCNYCKIRGHIETVCKKKKRSTQTRSKKLGISQTGSKKSGTKAIHQIPKETLDKMPELQLPVKLNGTHTVDFEIDTGAGDNFLGRQTWRCLGQPDLTEPDRQFESASLHNLPVLGSIRLDAQVVQNTSGPPLEKALEFQVADIPDLNLLGRSGITELNISVDALLNKDTSSSTTGVHAVFSEVGPNEELQAACRQLCEAFPDLFKPELGTLKDVELEIKFKPDALPVFRKPRPVPLALQEDLAQAYEAGIRNGVWKRAQFNNYGTPVVPVRKNLQPGQSRARL